MPGAEVPSTAKRCKPADACESGTAGDTHNEGCWHGMPPELLGRVFHHLDDEERCSIVPLVSRGFLQIHLDHPPDRFFWQIQHVTPPMVAWFRKIASSLETLWVFTSPTHPNYGPQILSLASICAPKLQHLVMAGVIVSPALHPLAFLSQIKTLVLSDWLMPGGDDVMEVSGLSGLRALEEIDFQQLNLTHSSAEQAAALWRALAALPNLHSALVCTLDDDKAGGLMMNSKYSFFFDYLSLLTQIRRLTLGRVEKCMAAGFILHSSLGTLTQLTSLTFQASLLSRSYYPVLGLTLLNNLVIHINDVNMEPAALPLEARKLRTLKIGGGTAISVDNLLPPATAALPSLESLALVHMKHQAFPSSVAERLMSLTDLDLSGNSFGRLPAALTRISTLNTLNMSRNDDLQMEKGDSDTLAALPNLRMVLLKKADRQIKSWSAASLAELIHISTRFPNLVLTV